MCATSYPPILSSNSATSNAHPAPPSVEPFTKVGLMIAPAYGILAFALWASWQLRSTVAIVAVALLAAGLAVLTYGTFSGVKAAVADMRFETLRQQLDIRPLRKRARHDGGASPDSPIVEATSESQLDREREGSRPPLGVAKKEL